MKYIKLYEEINFEEEEIWEEEDDMGDIPDMLSLGEYEELVGRKVRIRKNSVYYTHHEQNPRDVDGKLKFNYDFKNKYSSYIPKEQDHIFEVDWDNGEHNSYRAQDLELVN